MGTYRELPGGVSSLAGTANQGFSDGVGTVATFNEPCAASVTNDGRSLLVIDRFNQRIRVVDIATGDFSTTLATGFNNPSDIALSPDGVAFVSDTTNHRIQVLNISTGHHHTLAGSGSAGWQDGTGTNAIFNTPLQIALTPDKQKLLVADAANRRIRLVDIASGTVSTFAG